MDCIPPQKGGLSVSDEDKHSINASVWPHMPVSQAARCLIMKFLVLALAALGSVSASKAVTCDECQAAVTDLVARLLSEESLAEQIAILKLTVCPQV